LQLRNSDLADVITFSYFSNRSTTFKTIEDGQVLLNQNSVNAKDSQLSYPWLVFNEKVKTNSVMIRDSTGVSDSMLLLFGGQVTAHSHYFRSFLYADPSTYTMLFVSLSVVGPFCLVGPHVLLPVTDTNFKSQYAAVVPCFGLGLMGSF
jgi:hypothetical protein